MEAKDPFEWWYTLPTLAARLDKCTKTIRRWLDEGRFGPAPGQPGCLARQVGGEWLVPWSAVRVFLGVKDDAPIALTLKLFRARTEGELRRRVCAESGRFVAAAAQGRAGNE